MAETIPSLLCDSCLSPLCSLSDIIAERTEVLDKAVYGYELEVLENDVWVYSATNPHERRFDVVRCSSSLVATSAVRCEKTFSADHSWFPPHEWCMCECASCGRHLGWGFSLPLGKELDDNNNLVDAVNRSEKRCREDDEGEEATLVDDSQVAPPAGRVISFVGIIVTNCKAEQEYPLPKYLAEMDAAVERAERHIEFQRKLKKLFRALPRIQDQFVANQLGMALLGLRYANRDAVVDGLLVQAEALLVQQGETVSDEPRADDDVDLEYVTGNVEEGEEEGEEDESWATEEEEEDEDASNDNDDDDGELPTTL